MTARHAAALALVGWLLWLHYGPHPENHEEWSGRFESKALCEDALKHEQTHWYDGNQGHGKPNWVRGLYGCCQDESAQYRCTPSAHQQD